MNWLQIGIETTHDAIEPLCGILYVMGITGTEIEDAEDFVTFLEENKNAWDYVDDELMKKASMPSVVKIYLSDNESGLEMLENIKIKLDELKAGEMSEFFGPLTVSSVSMKEQDWAETWKKFYKPLTVGDKILIRPEWENVENTDGKVVFTINPGMSFGTGTHESTQLCLESAEKYVKSGDTVCDFGCGSGILSIVSLLLGASSAVAVDIDPNAVKIAMENAAKNNILSDRYSAYAGNVLSDEALREKISEKKYDVVFANIVADVIIALSPFAYDCVKKGGYIITSGIILSRLDEVREKLLSCGFEICEVNTKREWASVTAKRVR